MISHTMTTCVCMGKDAQTPLLASNHLDAFSLSALLNKARSTATCARQLAVQINKNRELKQGRHFVFWLPKPAPPPPKKNPFSIHHMIKKKKS